MDICTRGMPNRFGSTNQYYAFVEDLQMLAIHMRTEWLTAQQITVAIDSLDHELALVDHLHELNRRARGP